MTNVPAFGTALQSSDIAFALSDQLSGMGDYLTQEVGSLNWIECLTNARQITLAKQYITLLSNQLSPNSASVFLNRWAKIYNTLGLADPDSIIDFIELKQSEFGTPPILTNLISFMQGQLGSIFIDLECTPELQGLATKDPTVQILQDGYSYQAPLNNVMVYVWQTRDNQDNLLIPNSIFNDTVESYRQIIDQWNPAYITFITMNLINRGFQDGYANNHNGLNFNNYLDGYNIVSGSASSTTITGVGTAFKTYPDGSNGDFIGAVNEGFYPPIQIVDDLGILQTYFVSHVSSNTSLTITTPLINNITSRTYRTLGFILDTDGMLDFGGLFNV
jgi:hypothetical protein